MSSLEDHQSRDFTKLLVIGDSKTGKTGALSSLVFAGYKLRILDYDNGLDILKQAVQRRDRSLLSNVEFRTLRDKREWVNNESVIKGTPTAFADGIKMLDRWKYKKKIKNEEVEIDLGIPAKWGPDCILVIDSLTFMSDAAYDHREPLTPRGKGGEYDGRAVYGDAQHAIENTLALLTSDGFQSNVIVIAHVNYQDNPDGTTKGYPVSVGKKLSPKIPTYFNNYVRFVFKGGKRVIETKSSPMFDLANAKPFELDKDFHIEDGMAKIFEALRT